MLPWWTCHWINEHERCWKALLCLHSLFLSLIYLHSNSFISKTFSNFYKAHEWHFSFRLLKVPLQNRYSLCHSKGLFYSLRVYMLGARIFFFLINSKHKFYAFETSLRYETKLRAGKILIQALVCMVSPYCTHVCAYINQIVQYKARMGCKGRNKYISVGGMRMNNVFW